MMVNYVKPSDLANITMVYMVYVTRLLCHHTFVEVKFVIVKDFMEYCLVNIFMSWMDLVLY